MARTGWVRRDGLDVLKEQFSRFWPVRGNGNGDIDNDQERGRAIV